ncbi:MAG: transcription antitermination factor NusB [Candidatus Omnitrophica bacterium]|nr:transcription antitermination factor NusB [Candidatus Omnitrophota bacterium]
MRKRTHSRECALQILYSVDIRKAAPLVEISTDYWQKNSEDDTVKQFAMLLVEGTCKNLKNIDKLITEYTDNWRIERMAVIDRNIIRMATFELIYLEQIPPKVAINEAVDLAKRFGDGESGRFVNGVLDKINKQERKNK